MALFIVIILLVCLLILSFSQQQNLIKSQKQEMLFSLNLKKKKLFLFTRSAERQSKGSLAVEHKKGVQSSNISFVKNGGRKHCLIQHSFQ